MKRITLGITAHVDAGKTTLSEAMLFHSGKRKEPGRVDKRSSLLDNHTIERERGITIFSKLAPFDFGNTSFTLVDTPGHMDFFQETLRTLGILDYAVLVISASDGAVSHTVTLYKLLTARRIPTFIFVNKTDLGERRRIDILEELRAALSPDICDFNLLYESPERFYEECAGHDEALMADFFEGIKPTDEALAIAIKRGSIVPCIFGSALRDIAVDRLMMLLDRFTISPTYSKTLFGAKIFKIMTLEDGTRLSYMKLTGGTLRLKDTIAVKSKDVPGEYINSRVEQIRLYTADRFKLLQSAEAGEIVAIPSLRDSRAGMGLGTAQDDDDGVVPVLDYRMIFDEGCNIHEAYLKLLPLAEEEPTLGMTYDEKERQVRVRLMGEIQTEVLQKIIKQRFGLNVSFGEARIHYKETILETAYGAGHFEPLMHYAEVRLRLEPLPEGSGLVFKSEVPQDRLKINWQRLILSHFEERVHRGKLIGAPITDMKITLIAGRAHPKHTEGGDFRQATYRALNQGLMKASLRLLEPTFDFEAMLPEGSIGRFMYDIERMAGECETPVFEGGNAIIRGYAPVYGLRSYQTELRSYTRGEGKINLTPAGYMPCHNEDEIIAEYAYDAEGDTRANPNSIFCKGGAGYLVPWYMADEKMHTENPEQKAPEQQSGTDTVKSAAVKKDYRGTVEEDRELMRIFESTYGKIKPRCISERKENSKKAESEVPRRRPRPKLSGEEYLIIDGYNLIHASEELKQLAEGELSHARDRLIHMMCNYRGYKKCRLIIVFDAYKRKGGEGSEESFGDVTVIYTKERQTADAYIERATYKINPPDRVRVVTADYNEQLIVLGNGGIRVTPNEFLAEIEEINSEIRGIIDNN